MVEIGYPSGSVLRGSERQIDAIAGELAVFNGKYAYAVALGEHGRETLFGCARL